MVSNGMTSTTSGPEFAVAIDRARCDGEAKCFRLCPVRVFSLERPAPDLGWVKRAKVVLHGGRLAVVVNPSACIGCMACVEACPDRAVYVFRSDS